MAKLVKFEKCGHTVKLPTDKVMKVLTDPAKKPFVCPSCQRPSSRWYAKNA